MIVDVSISSQVDPTTESLYGLLSGSARRHPQGVAVDFLGTRMTYAQLAGASERLAGFLSSRGIGPGHRVGFYFHKCVDALIALFALIRVGATYVPFDLQVPTTRIQAICKQCGIRTIVAGALPRGLKHLDRALVSEPADDDESFEGELISLADALRAGQPLDGPAPPPEDGIANILYTSGSTGRPKGVMVTTRSLLHFSRWGVETFGLSPADRVANHAPYSFDLATFDIFAAVRAGATMCPFPDAARGHPYRTTRFIAQERITVWYSVPWCLVLMVLRGSLAAHDVTSLRHVLFAGEVMPPEHLRTWMELAPQASYWNLYGPTETNVCTYHKVQAADLDDPEGIPIGRPIRDTRAWVVDAKGAPLPAGEVGELLVAGPTVFAGYHRDRKASAKRLVDAPDGEGPACKTGDRVYERDDGVLVFQGRNDRMVKSRGYRIEPGEIEAVVAEHPAVAEAAVVSVKHLLRGTSLTGFVSLQDDQELSPGELSAYCREHLPPYMVPNQWEFLDRLPRTPHGKIDLTGLAKQAK